MIRLKRRKRVRANIRKNLFVVSGHDQHVRGYECCVSNADCKGRIEAHHVRKGIPDEDRGGIGKKPHDKWLVPLCRFHHIADFHTVGHETFEATHKVDLISIASIFWERSPAGRKYRMEREKQNDHA